jgi:GTPase
MDPLISLRGGCASPCDGRACGGDCAWRPPQAPLRLPEQQPRLPPERDRGGSCEYKALLPSLAAAPASKLTQLTTQLAWRLREGGGSAVYYLGVSDGGAPHGLPPAALLSSLRTLEAAAAGAGAALAAITVRRGDAAADAEVAEVRVVAAAALPPPPLKQTPPTPPPPREARLALAGAGGAGKSTLLGCLLSGSLDDGRGLARTRVVRHPHEVLSGRSSSIARHVVGFDASEALVVRAARKEALGLVLAPQPLARAPPDCSPARARPRAAPDVLCAAGASPREIAAASAQLLTLLDLPGNSRYARSTLAGLVGGAPDAVAVLADARQVARCGGGGGGGGSARAAPASDGLPPACAALEHLHISLSLSLPTCVVLTHADLVDGGELAAATRVVDAFVRRHRGGGADGDASAAAARVDSPTAARAAAAALGAAGEPVPVFVVSCVSGAGLAPLLAFLARVAPHGAAAGERERELPEPAELVVQEVLDVEGCTVVAGLVVTGAIRAGDVLLVGPESAGAFAPARVACVHVHGAPAAAAAAGQLATLQLLEAGGSSAGANFSRGAVRRGHVLLAAGAGGAGAWRALSPAAPARVCRSVLISVRPSPCAAGGSAPLRAGAALTAFVGAARQAATACAVREAGGGALHVTLRFGRSPEYVRVGGPVVLMLSEGGFAAGCVLELLDGAGDGAGDAPPPGARRRRAASSSLPSPAARGAGAGGSSPADAPARRRKRGDYGGADDDDNSHAAVFSALRSRG